MKTFATIVVVLGVAFAAGEAAITDGMRNGATLTLGASLAAELLPK